MVIPIKERCNSLNKFSVLNICVVDLLCDKIVCDGFTQDFTKFIVRFYSFADDIFKLLFFRL